MTGSGRLLSAQDLLAGGSLTHAIEIPERVLRPGVQDSREAIDGFVRIRPLSVGTLTLISRAARDDASLVPLLMIKESLAEPVLTLDQIRRLHIGLVHFLVEQINTVSGLGPDGDAIDATAAAALGKTHVLLAKHFGWTPEQVAQLTPAQVAVYLKGLEVLLERERRGESE
jgi:hypothetical protein